MPAPKRPCVTLDPEWWDTGDDGNRLALMLCDLCPGCILNDPHPYGVIATSTANGPPTGRQ